MNQNIFVLIPYLNNQMYFVQNLLHFFDSFNWQKLRVSFVLSLYSTLYLVCIEDFDFMKNDVYFF